MEAQRLQAKRLEDEHIEHLKLEVDCIEGEEEAKRLEAEQLEQERLVPLGKLN